MYLRRCIRVGAIATLSVSALVLSGARSAAPSHAQAPPQLSANATVFATGLNNPRGLRFGPDGNLYVAEAGLGGTNSTIGQCQQVPGPPGPGPVTGGFTSRISKISSDGTRTTVIDHLPSSITNPTVGSQITGVADIQFIDGTLYGMEGGAGCSHGLLHTNNTIFRVNSDGTRTNIANLSAFLKAHPVTNPDAGDL